MNSILELDAWYGKMADRAGRFSSPFRTRDAPWLAQHGFVVDEAGSMWFYAPDTEVLQHDAFLGTHCFRVVRDDDRPNLVGLEFSPADGMDHPDVRSTLAL